MANGNGTTEAWPTWAKLAAGLGFPIVACVGLFYLLYSVIIPAIAKSDAIHAAMQKSISRLEFTNQVMCEKIVKDGAICIKPPPSEAK